MGLTKDGKEIVFIWIFGHVDVMVCSSRMNPRGDHNRRTAIKIYISAHTKCSLAGIDNSMVRAARKPRSR